MARETCGFDDWLWCAERATAGQGLTAALDALSEGLDRAYRVHIWFAEILGKRWSYIAGFIDEKPSVEGTERIEISHHLGMVADSWGCLQPDECTRLIAFIGGLVALKSTSLENVDLAPSSVTPPPSDTPPPTSHQESPC